MSPHGGAAAVSNSPVPLKAEVRATSANPGGRQVSVCRGSPQVSRHSVRSSRGAGRQATAAADGPPVRAARFILPASQMVGAALQQNYLRSDCLAGGPLLLPGRPFMFDVSCVWFAGFCWFAPAAEPTVSPGLAAGPFLFPGWPAIPAPEFCASGVVETPGLVVCASAAGADIASARMAMLNVVFMTSPRKIPSQAIGLPSLKRAREPRVPAVDEINVPQKPIKTPYENNLRCLCRKPGRQRTKNGF